MPRRTDSPSSSRLRAFVRRHTRLRPVADVPGVRLHMADDVMTVMRLAGDELGQSDPPLPFWAFPWAGGLAVSRYLLEHPDEVADRHVLDLASGSGLCAIVAMRMGAASAQAVDIDPLAEAAVALNAHANGVRIGFSRHDILDEPPPAADIVLAGDVCYEETMADRMLGWLRQAARNGTRVIIGDPGRAYLPSDVSLLATYRVTTSRELEDAEVKPSAVYTLPGAGSV
jgi:predicted nicotinamide N-methyase